MVIIGKTWVTICHVTLMSKVALTSHTSVIGALGHSGHTYTATAPNLTPEHLRRCPLGSSDCGRIVLVDKNRTACIGAHGTLAHPHGQTQMYAVVHPCQQGLTCRLL